MNGSDASNSPGTYGIKGVPSVNNSPRSVYQAGQWIDKSGNLWIFGGMNFAFEAPSEVLWKYDPVANTWTWIQGQSSLEVPVYGCQGIPSPNNHPGGRAYGIATWTDNNGDLWMFGGLGVDAEMNYTSLNDLWRYNIATDEWTWMAGSSIAPQSGIYGTQGLPSDSNSPPSRYETNGTWVDQNNNFWLFGGMNYSPNTAGFNDMWRYSVATNQWTWMNGVQGPNHYGNYGILGVDSSINVPYSRNINTHWMGNQNDLYLWGGWNNYYNQRYSDFWRFSLITNNWTWVGGDTISDAYGNYFQECSDSNNIPPARFENKSAQLSSCNNLMFTFGGWRYDDSYSYNDLWSFDNASQLWTWINGGPDSINAVGSYGVQGVPNITNSPPARAGNCFWADNNNNLWVWGGWGVSGINYNFLNDMWKFTLDTTCIPIKSVSSELNFNVSNTTICKGDTIFLSIWGDSAINIYPANNVTWVDSFHALIVPDSNINYTISGFTSCGNFVSLMFSTKLLPDSIFISANKNFTCQDDTVQICAPVGFAHYMWNTGDSTACIMTTVANTYIVTVTSGTNCSAISNMVNIVAYQISPVTISVSGDTLSAYNTGSYQWLLNGVPITGATSATYIANSSGTYTLQVTDSNGCVATSSPVVIAGISNELPDNSISIFPNPTNTSWQLAVSSELIGSVVKVFDATGRVVFQSAVGNRQLAISIPGAASGVYELRITSGDYSVVRKLVKM